MILTQTWAHSVSPRKEQTLPWFRKKADFESNVQGELAVLYRVARRMGCNNEEAEDVVQSTIIKAYKAWEKFDGRHLRSWLIRILRNERLMALRSREDQHASIDEAENYEIPEEPFWEDLSWKLQAEKIIEELQNLPDIYRMAVHLCDVEELTYEEAAEAMDVPVGTVRSRLFRARAMLRQRLAHCIEVPTGGNS